MQLIYRGHIYTHISAEPKIYIKPCAVNWRYQVPGETYGGVHVAKAFVLPRAINWRYQVPAV